MAKKDYSKSDNRAFTISLMASLFTVILITFIEIITDILNAYDCKITPFLAKILIMGILIVVLKYQWKDYNSNHRNR